MACQAPLDLLDGMEEKDPQDREDFRDQKFDEVTSAEREVLDPRDLLALKEKKNKKDMGCQVSVTTAGDERTALAMQL